MEKRKTIWFSVLISELIQAAEEKSSITIQISYDELMKQILDDSSLSTSISAKSIFGDFLGTTNNEERSTVVQCRFEQSFLKGLLERKEGYSISVNWKTALSLALDPNYWGLNIPAKAEEEEYEDEEEDEYEDEDEEEA